MVDASESVEACLALATITGGLASFRYMLLVRKAQAFASVLAALNSFDPVGVVEVPADRLFQAGLEILLWLPTQFA